MIYAPFLLRYFSLSIVTHFFVFVHMFVLFSIFCTKKAYALVFTHAIRFINLYLSILPSTFLIGTKSTRQTRKLLAPCIRSYGIPAIHQENPILHPPIQKYGMLHNAPNKSPNTPESIANTHTLVCLRSFHVTNANSGHA